MLFLFVDEFLLQKLKKKKILIITKENQRKSVSFLK